MIAGERAALRSWSAGLRAASSEGQVISQSVSQGYNASLVLRCGEELDEATASLVEMAESSGVAVSIRKECFVAGTLIHTREGEKAIEEIGEGDEVLSYNPQTQQTEYKPVVQTFTHEARELLNVGIEGESEALGVTATHPFYVRRARDCTSDGDGDDSPSQASSGEWVAAKELKAGDLVRRPNGAWVRVEKVESRARGEQVYNFEVADNHNYFVGRQGTLVHNTCKEYDTVPYRPTIQGFENHHGILDKWASENISGYKSRAGHNPTIALTPLNHDATKAVYREWLFERTGKRVGGQVNWKQVTWSEVKDLSERMFDAAKVPKRARRTYYKEFERYIQNLGVTIP